MGLGRVFNVHVCKTIIIILGNAVVNLGGVWNTWEELERKREEERPCKYSTHVLNSQRFLN